MTISRSCGSLLPFSDGLGEYVPPMLLTVLDRIHTSHATTRRNLFTVLREAEYPQALRIARVEASAAAASIRVMSDLADSLSSIDPDTSTRTMV